jgi:hypothetical protein
MIYMPGEWSEKELKSLFNFAPEDVVSEDSDVLYSGEMIDAKNGGIKYRLYDDIQQDTPGAQSKKNLTEISIEPYSIQGNLFEIKNLNNNSTSRQASGRDRGKILEELTGVRSIDPAENKGKRKNRIT